MSHPFQPTDAVRFINPDPTIDTLSKPMMRGIGHVEDGRPGQCGTIRTAAEVLDLLDARELTLLRRLEFTSRESGRPLFHCAVCGSPVHSRVLSAIATEMTGGRRAYFVHDPRGAARFCPCGNLSDGKSAAMIDAQRFAGRQEGRRHAALKFDLMDALQRDPAFSDVGVEQIVRDRGAWRKPDVLAETEYGRIGFDIQLAPPLLDSIVGRQRFYAAADVGHLWIVDASNPDCLNKQGFQDVVMPQGGVVLGFDEQSAAVTAESGELTMHLLNVSEDSDRRRFIVSSELIGRGLILELAGLRSPSAPPVARDLRAATLFCALREGDQRKLATSFATIAAGCGVQDIAEAKDDGVFGVIATLATLITGRKADTSGFADGAVNAVVNHFLRPEQAGMRPNHVHRGWAPVLARAAFHPSVRFWIDKRGTKTRGLLNAALAEAAIEPEFTHQLTHDWLPVLHRLFPGLRLLGLQNLIASASPD